MLEKPSKRITGHYLHAVMLTDESMISCMTSMCEFGLCNNQLNEYFILVGNTEAVPGESTNKK